MAADPVSAVSGFIDCINRRDIDGLAALMTEDHALRVFDESPLVGREPNVDAWRGYFASFPAYRITPERVVVRDDVVAVRGHTTGSHLGLPNDEERLMTVFWVAEVVDGNLRSWRLVDDTPDLLQDG